VSADALQRLRSLLEGEGGLISSLLNGHGPQAPLEQRADGFRPSALLAGAPRTEDQREEYELLVEAIYEGYLLHYGTPRVLGSSEQNLALLAGDRLYALGLARLVALGDTHAVCELADTITLCALAHGAGNAALARAVWAAGVRSVGWGPSAAHARAKELVLANAPDALDAMRTSAR
jgi:hypothetical protein